MSKLIVALTSMIAALGASIAIAQDQAPPAGQEPEAQASSETQIAITQQDIDNFAKALIKVNQIQNDGLMDDAQKQAATIAAVEENDLDPMKLNTIAEASKTELSAGWQLVSG